MINIISLGVVMVSLPKVLMHCECNLPVVVTPKLFTFVMTPMRWCTAIFVVNRGNAIFWANTAARTAYALCIKR